MTIRIEKRGRRIVIQTRESLPGLKTAVPGAYQTVAGYWTVPLSIESCILLKEKYGNRLTAGNELTRWVRTVQGNRRSMRTLAESKTVKLHVLPKAAPKLYRAMKARKYQLVGARFVADADSCLVADEPGLGKTLIAMGGLLEGETEGPYLIVCPKTASDAVWRKEITRWLPPDHRVVILPQHRYKREHRLNVTRYGPKTWVIVHPEIMMVQQYVVCRECGKRTVYGGRKQRFLDCYGVNEHGEKTRHKKTPRCKKEYSYSYPRLFRVEWGAVIADESHEMLIQRKGVPTQRRRGMDLVTIRPDGKHIALSGTPFDSKPHQLFGTLNWLDPQTHKAFHRWSELYWTKGGYTGYEIGEFRKDREAMLWRSLDGVALRRTKAEVAKDLPPKIYVGTNLDPRDTDSPVGIWLPMEGKQEKAYRAMEAVSIAELETGTLSATSTLAELTRLKQLACAYGEIRGDKYHPSLPSNKHRWIVESLEEWGYPREPIDKIIIVSFFSGILRSFAWGIEERFKTKPGKRLCTGITGRTPAHMRRKVIADFNDPNTGPQIMMLNVRAGGTAITIDSASRMIFVSETRIPDQQIQAENRNHRVSKPRQCFYYYLRSEGTVDVGTALVNQELARASHRLLDGRRGVDYFQRVLDLSRI
jgi:SNF2 family DNA or RNA helicase